MAALRSFRAGFTQFRPFVPEAQPLLVPLNQLTVRHTYGCAVCYRRSLEFDERWQSIRNLLSHTLETVYPILDEQLILQTHASDDDWVVGLFVHHRVSHRHTGLPRGTENVMNACGRPQNARSRLGYAPWTGLSPEFGMMKRPPRSSNCGAHWHSAS